MKEYKGLTRALAAILTVAFLGVVFAAFAVTLRGHYRELLDSVRLTAALEATLPERWNRLDVLQARINALTAKMSEIVWMKEDLGYVNSAFQRALGKRVVNTGSQNMITLTTGHLYDLMDYKPLERNARDIVELRDTLLKDTPFLFVYEHPTLYAPGMLPAGYEPLDHSAEMAAEVIGILRANGIDVLDTRDVIPADGRPLEDFLMYTDQHWSTLSAITVARHIAERLAETAGAPLDPSLLDLDRFNTLTHEKLFLGKYGQRVGPRAIDPDDIIEYWPKYDTYLTRRTKRVVSLEEASGTFRAVATRASRLEPDPGKTYNLLAYTYYGQVEAFNNFTNLSAPDYTILLLKDSYSAPVGTFMSLLARNVLTVDLRRDVEPLETWLETYKPDAVVMAYSLQMLRDDEYAFGG